MRPLPDHIKICARSEKEASDALSLSKPLEEQERPEQPVEQVPQNTLKERKEEKSLEELQRARRPLSYAKASCAVVSTEALSETKEPCEGRQASPSNPTKGSRKSAKRELNAVVVFRCTAFEKQALIEKSKRSGRPFADLMREALGLADSRRRKPVPRVDPDLIRSVSRIGSNVNQIARWLNASTAAGHTKDIDAVVVASQLIALDRSLNALIERIASPPSQVEDERC